MNTEDCTNIITRTTSSLLSCAVGFDKTVQVETCYKNYKKGFIFLIFLLTDRKGKDKNNYELHINAANM